MIDIDYQLELRLVWLAFHPWFAGWRMLAGQQQSLALLKCGACSSNLHCCLAPGRTGQSWTVDFAWCSSVEVKCFRFGKRYCSTTNSVHLTIGPAREWMRAMRRTAARTWSNSCLWFRCSGPSGIGLLEWTKIVNFVWNNFRLQVNTHSSKRCSSFDWCTTCWLGNVPGTCHRWSRWACRSQYGGRCSCVGGGGHSMSCYRTRAHRRTAAGQCSSLPEGRVYRWGCAWSRWCVGKHLPQMDMST